MESLVNVTQEEQGDILILRVEGRLDATSSPVLDKKVSSFIDNDKCNVVMNFYGVEYLSSAGMRLLLSATKKLKSKDGKMVISGITEPVMEVIKMAGFDRILTIVATEEDAIREFA